MRVPALRAAGAAISLFIGSIEAASAQTVTPEMFGTLPSVDEVAISPDGATLAALHNASDIRGVVFYDVATRAPKGGFRIGRGKARDLQWADNENLLLLASVSRDLAYIDTAEVFRWLVFSRKNEKLTTLFGDESFHYIFEPGDMLSTLPDTPGTVLFARWTEGATRYANGTSTGGHSLFTVELPKGRTTLVEGGLEDTFQWVVDLSGKIIARVDYSDRLEQVQIYSSREGASRLERLTTRPAPRFEGATHGLQGLSAATGGMVATTRAYGDKRALIEFDMNTGADGAILFSNPQYDIGSVGYDPHAARVRAVHYTDDMPQAHYLDQAERKIQDALKNALPGGAPRIVSRAADNNRWIIRVAYNDQPDQFFLFDRKTRELAFLFDAYEQLAGKILAQKEKYDFATSDGVTVPGYLTRPAGSASKNMPLIVLPHGGPASRDDQSFDWWAFFYAARGYLVYQPNFRGSAGYGHSFLKAGEGEWGRKMQRDITEGVQGLIADGTVDPARICIVGGSYGGYAALVGATLTPDLYACAVSVAGVSDLREILRAARNAGNRAKQYWEKELGVRMRDEALLDEVSPVRGAARVKAPILLIHGKDDAVVPLAQSRAMAKALKDNNKAYELVELEDEDHWLSTGATRTEMLARSIEFIDKHIGPNSSAAN